MKTIPNIIKVITAFAFFFCTFNAGAQVRYGTLYNIEFRIGGNSSEFDIKDANRDKAVKMGFNLALLYTQKLFYSDFQFQTGVVMTKKGMKQDKYSLKTNELEGEKIERNTRVTTDANYVQIPFMLGFETYLNSNFAINLNAGAYGAVGFKGKIKEKGSVSTSFGSMEPIVESIRNSQNTFKDGNLKKFDYGLTGSVGLVYDVYTLTLGYDWGLYDVSDDNTRILKNRNLTLSVGLRF